MAGREWSATEGLARSELFHEDGSMRHLVEMPVTLRLIGKHIDISAFRENVKHTLEEGLADRLDEAIRRVNGGAC